MRTRRISFAALMAGTFAGGALAGTSYEFTPTSGGQNSIVLDWGDSFSIDVNVAITGDTLPGFNSAVFQMRFTEPGLMLNSYAWDAPFGTGDIFDDSTPDPATLPAAIVPGTFLDPQIPMAVDIEFSNVSITQSYSTGALVSLELVVPENFGFTGILFVSVAPDTIADGFTPVPAIGGQVLQIEIIPAPMTAALFVLGGCAAARRRREL